MTIPGRIWDRSKETLQERGGCEARCKVSDLNEVCSEERVELRAPGCAAGREWGNPPIANGFRAKGSFGGTRKERYDIYGDG